MTPVAEIFVELMSDVDPALPLPESLCRLTVRRLPVAAASLALTGRSGSVLLMAGSSDQAAALADLQLTLGEGPFHDAMHTGTLVLQSDLARTGPVRWPHFTEAATALGVRSIFSFPLLIGAIRLGVMELICDEPLDLEDADLAEALSIVDAAAYVVLHLSADGLTPAPRLDAVGEAMTEAFHFYATVHQATGIVSVQAGVELADALLMLRAFAFSHDRTIVAVAHDVVNRSLSFGPT